MTNHYLRPTEAIQGEAFHYTACGLDDVYLLNGVDVMDTDYGPAFRIHRIDGLHRAIAADIIARKKRMNGKELRFLRKELNLSQSGLALLLGVDDQSVARWEKGKTQISPPADRLIRVILSETLEGRTEVTALLELLGDLDDLETERRCFTETEGEWHIAA